MRAGDLVYLTVPEGGRQVFDFDPIPVEQAMDSAKVKSVDYTMA